MHVSVAGAASFVSKGHTTSQQEDGSSGCVVAVVLALINTVLAFLLPTDVACLLHASLFARKPGRPAVPAMMTVCS